MLPRGDQYRIKAEICRGINGVSTGSFADFLHHDTVCLIAHRQTAILLIGRDPQEAGHPVKLIILF